ncbi:uncharacterized protein [Glycine max]|uniref:uncharacterized protein isoform X3 n=1 Tax=Glycine max TaxID=3847 RepID=UPI001B35444F|nr:uncharacterized protein LOC100808678 isoform X3 [Glycine max]
MTECVRLFDHPIIKVHILVLSGVDICVSWIIRPIKYPNIFQYEIKALLGAQLFDYPNILQESGWPILRRWEVPWQWQTVSLTSLACGLGCVLNSCYDFISNLKYCKCLTEAIALPYLGIKPDVLSLDDKAEILLFDQSITTAVVLGIIYSVANTFQPLPEDFFKYDLREPFNLQKGWLLWAGIGLAGAILAISLTGVAVSFFNGETPQRETDALVRLLPLIGSSNLSTACLVGITGVLAPLLEETVFRGFFMTSLTKWVPTPVAVVISAAVFALAHLTPGEFPQLFVLGTALGFSYAQTHNLLTPITIHSFWNSGVILFLTFLQVLIITHVCVCSVWFTASRVRYQRIIAGNLMEKISPLHGCGASCTVYNTNPFLCLSALLSVL